MLHKKFKSSKCKTALNLAKSRLKLLRNKKDIQVKQLRRDVAQLLQSGQDQTARIRVEHVVREENTMAAFELIEIYCELLVARLPILESQKVCPLDLKEAVTSLIFAAPRCGDIPELQDVRKHLTTKYGKEFVAAATELRPNCGVSRNLVEKLSVKAPDGPTKVKILTAIAEEHNIKWEPRWFEDEKPVPSVEIPQKEQHMEKADEKIQTKPLNYGIDDKSAGRLKVSSQNHPPASVDVDEALPPTSYPDGRPGDFSDRKAQSHSSGIAKSPIEEGRPSWTMEFKDAAAAAQAAAESAERASMAARAAAELSRRQSNFVGESSSTGSFNQRDPRADVDRVDPYHQGNVVERSEATSSVKSSTKSGVGYTSERADYSDDKNTVHLMHNTATQSGDSLPTSNAPEAKYDVFEYPKQIPFDEVAHEEVGKLEVHPGSFEHRSSSFGDAYDDIFSNSNVRYDSNHSDDNNRGYSFYRDQGEGGRISGSEEQKYKSNWGNNIFLDTKDDVNDMNDKRETGTHTNGGAVFDEFGSDDDDDDDDDIVDMNDQKETLVHADSVPAFDEFGSDDDDINDMNDKKERGAHADIVPAFDKSDSSSSDEGILNPAGKSYDHDHFPSNSKSSVRAFSVRQDSLGIDVSESFRMSDLFAKLSEPVNVKFDSDVESSDSERELPNEIHNNDLHSLKTSYEGTSSREEPLCLDHGSDYDQKPLPSPRLPSLSSNPSLESKNEMTQADSEDGMKLNFVGSLPSARSNRQMRDPPYRRGSVGETEITPISKKTSGIHTDFNSTNNVSQIEVTSESSNMATNETSARTWKDPTGYFNPYESSSDDDTPKQQPSIVKNTRLGAGLSRRTKGSATTSVPSSQPSTTRGHIRDSTSYAKEVSSKQTQTVNNPTWVESQTRLDPPQSKVSDTSSLPRASNSNEKAPSTENSVKKMGHVHPKLPDFESVTAQMLSRRTDRQK